MQNSHLTWLSLFDKQKKLKNNKKIILIFKTSTYSMWQMTCIVMGRGRNREERDLDFEYKGPLYCTEYSYSNSSGWFIYLLMFIQVIISFCDLTELIFH